MWTSVLLTTMKVTAPNFAKRNGLVTVVVQDLTTKEVLMVAHTNQDGYLETLETGHAVFWSTSRNERWKKGEHSGAIQHVREIRIDCDGDALIYLVDQEGSGACHTGARTCFFRDVIVRKPLLASLPGDDCGVELGILNVHVAESISPPGE